MATYGDFPGVKVTTEGGGITALDIGTEETLVLFGRGDPDSSQREADYDTPTRIAARQDANTQFGSGSELADAMQQALANGANISYLYGVMPTESGAGGSIDTTTDTPTESVTGTQTGELLDYPLVTESGYYAVRDAVDSQDMTVNLVYESPPSTPADANTININPLTGEFEADTPSDYDFFYNYLDWSNAFDAADSVVGEDDTGLYVALSEAESVSSMLTSKTTELRENYQLVSGLTSAMPNATGSDGDPYFDTPSYSDGIDDDKHFLFAPVRYDGDRFTALGPLGGLFSGSQISDPIYNDQITTNGRDLAQSLTRNEAQQLRSAYVIPLRQAGSIRVRDNLSTSEEVDWQRDFWRRRIVDRTVLIAKAVGDRLIGRINDEQTRNVAERTIRTELQSLANDRLIEDNDGGETNFYVDVYEDSNDPDQVNIDIGVTPQGIVKRVDQTVTINT